MNATALVTPETPAPVGPLTDEAPPSPAPPAPPAQASHSRKPAPKSKKSLPPLTPVFALGILSSALGYVREAGIEVIIGNHAELGAVIAIKEFRAASAADGQPPDLVLATDLPDPAMTGAADNPAGAGKSEIATQPSGPDKPD